MKCDLLGLRFCSPIFAIFIRTYDVINGTVHNINVKREKKKGSNM